MIGRTRSTTAPERDKRVTGLLLAALAAAAIWAVSIAQAQAAGDQMDTAAGRSLAQTWCSSCHNVEPSVRAQSLTAGGPPDFGVIATAPTTTELGLKAFLQTPHARMPDFQLSRNHVDQLTQYILSLKGQ